MFREISLTFDDAPTNNGTLLTAEERTDLLIQHLDEAGIKGAMFFVTTKNLIALPEGRQRLQQYVSAGHVLGNHSHNHLKLSDTCVSDYLHDIDNASAILSEFDSVAPFFRYPYLDEGSCRVKIKAVREGLQERGLKNGYVTVANYDFYLQALIDEAVLVGWKPEIEALRKAYVEVLLGSAEFYDELACKMLGRSPRHILLLHENDLAALFVKDLVVEFKARSWNFIPAVDSFGDAIACLEPDTTFLNQGRVAALAHAAGTGVRQLVPLLEEEEYLRRLLEERNLIPCTRTFRGDITCLR